MGLGPSFLLPTWRMRLVLALGLGLLGCAPEIGDACNLGTPERSHAYECRSLRCDETTNKCIPSATPTGDGYAWAAAFGHAPPTPGPQPLAVTLFDSLVHVTTIPAGIDCPPTCTASFASGTVVTLHRGNRGLWQPACRGEELDRCAIVVDAPTQVGVAPPAPPPPPPPPRPSQAELLVTVSRGGGGLVTSSNGTIRCGWSPRPQFFCRDLVTFGASTKKVVRLRARAGVHARLARWGGACRGTRPTCRLELLRNGRKLDRYPVTALFRGRVRG